MPRVDDRTRGWCLTINNYTAADEDRFTAAVAKYKVAGKETGDSGTPHLQCYIYFATKKTFTAIRRMFPGAHVEQAKGTADQNRVYCTKENLWHESGVIPVTPLQKGQNEAQRWATARTLAKQGDFENIDADIYFRYYSTMKRIYADNVAPPEDLPEPSAVWIWGLSGCGKSWEGFNLII